MSRKKTAIACAHLCFGAGCLTALLLASAFSPAQEGKKAANYYPLEAGNKWQSRIEVGGNSASATQVVAMIETIDKIPLARLETTLNGKVVATEHLSQTDKGIFRHRYNGAEVVPPLCLLKYPVKSGAKWDGDITVGKEKAKYFCETKEDSVEVPAGKFKAMRVIIRAETETNGEKKIITTTYWFVPNIGNVKQVFEAGDLNVLMELEKFEPANK